MKTKKMTNEQKKFHAEHEIITEVNELGQFARIDKHNGGVSTWSRFMKRYDILNSWPDMIEWLQKNFKVHFESYQDIEMVPDYSNGHVGAFLTPERRGLPDIKIIVKKKEISK